jgi:hypothetical protein
VTKAREEEPMKQEITVESFFAPMRGLKGLKMGEYTLHRDGQLERAGVKVQVGMLVLDDERRRIAVLDPHGRPMVTELQEACEPLVEDADERAAREHAETLGRTVLDLQGKLDAERATVEVLRAELDAANKRIQALTANQPAAGGFPEGFAYGGVPVAGTAAANPGSPIHGDQTEASGGSLNPNEAYRKS